MAVLAIQHSKRPTQARMKDEERCIHMTGNGSSPVLGRRLDLEFCASGQTQQLRKYQRKVPWSPPAAMWKVDHRRWGFAGKVDQQDLSRWAGDRRPNPTSCVCTEVWARRQGSVGIRGDVTATGCTVTAWGILDGWT